MDFENIIKGLLKVSISKYIIAFIIVTASLIINRYIVTKIFNILIRLVKKTKNYIDDSFFKALESPIKLYILLYSFYIALFVIDFDNLQINSLTCEKLKKVFLVIAICYFLYNLTLQNSFLHSKMKNNNMVFPFISIIIRLIIIIIGISSIAKEFGFTGFLAGLGISGVAFALMAQDAFSNLFGGVIIVLDRPFKIGDWIQTSQIEGIVEDITFRSTKIRTFSMAVATIPNSKLANENIINWSERNLRRIHFKFTISPKSNIENIKEALDKIKDILYSNEKIDNDLIIVSFNELSTYGFGIFIYFYTYIMDYKKYEELKQEINIEILRVLKDGKVDLIFINMNFDFINNDIRGSYENKNIDLESIKNITEEERSE